MKNTFLLIFFLLESILVFFQLFPSINLAANTAQLKTLSLNTGHANPPKIFLSAPLVEEESGPVNLSIYLEYRTDSPVTINLNTSGTAIKGVDYTLSAESVTIAVGDSLTTVQIIPINDNLVEPLESIIIGVSSATNASPLYPSMTTFLSSEDKPTLSLSSNVTTFSELNGIATVQATLAEPTSRDVSIDLIPSGTAVLSKDYSVDFLGRVKVVAEPYEVDNPRGIFVDANDNIYIADQNNNRIQKLAPGATSGVTVAGGNGQGSASNQLRSPSGVFVTANGDIYVADNGNNRIQKWAYGSSTGTTVAGGNGQGSAANQFNNVSALFIDQIGNIYACDNNNHRIQKWAPGAINGVTVAGGNGRGNAANQFDLPSDVFVDQDGNIFVCDSQNSRIQKWASGASSGITVAGGNGNGSAPNQLNYATGVYVDSTGNIYVADYLNHRVQKWFPGELSGITVASYARDQLTRPVKVTSNGNDLFISELYKRVLRIRSFPSLTITAGQTQASQTVTVRGIDDNDEEPDETIIFSPIAINADASSTSPLTLTITSNDGPPKISLKVPTVYEEKPPVELRISLSHLTYKPVTVNLTTSGEAIKGSDYTLSAESITIPAGDSVGIVQIIPINDNLVEGLKTIFISVSSATNAALPYPNITTFLSSEDKPNVGITANKSVISENDNVTITATLSAVTSRPVTVDFLLRGSAIYNTDYTANFSTKGLQTVSGFSSLGLPKGIFVDENGNIFVTDNSNHQVLKLAEGESNAVVIAGGNGSGSNANQLNNPGGIFVDNEGNLYIADTPNHRIQKWTPGATTGITVAGGNGAGANPYQLNNPESVFVDGAGNIYIADRGNHRIQKWTSGAITGITVAGGNGAGSLSSQFNLPTDVFVDSQGNIYVVDQNNYRIQKWTSGAVTGTTVAGGNGQGNSANQLNGPSGIYVDTDKSIYITDYYNNRIQKWEEGENKATTIANLTSPKQIHLDSRRRVFITGHSSIHLLQYQPQIVIPAGEFKGTVVLNSIEDSQVEDEEKILIKITGAINANPDTSTLTVLLAPVYPPAQPAPFTTSSVTVCRGQNNVIYTVPPDNNASSYIWTYSGTGATFSSTTNSVSINFSNTATSGTLSVKAQNILGISPERTINILVGAPPQPAAFINSTQYVCSGQSAVVYAVAPISGATSYTWSYSGTGATFSSSINSVSVNYSASATAGTLSVKANNSCGSSVPLTLDIAIIPNTIPQNIVLNGPLTVNNQVSHIAQKSIILSATSQNAISINAGSVFLAALATCPN